MEKRHLYKYDNKRAFNYVLKVDRQQEKVCIKKNLDFDNKFVNFNEKHKAHCSVVIVKEGNTNKENKKVEEKKRDNSGNKVVRIPTLFKASNK